MNEADVARRKILRGQIPSVEEAHSLSYTYLQDLRNDSLEATEIHHQFVSTEDAAKLATSAKKNLNFGRKLSEGEKAYLVDRYIQQVLKNETTTREEAAFVLEGLLRRAMGNDDYKSAVDIEKSMLFYGDVPNEQQASLVFKKAKFRNLVRAAHPHFTVILTPSLLGGKEIGVKSAAFEGFNDSHGVVVLGETWEDVKRGAGLQTAGEPGSALTRTAKKHQWGGPIVRAVHQSGWRGSE